MTEQITECKQVTDEKSLKATTVPKWLLCPEKDSNVIYPHRENIEITPLINGKEAFGALEDAIKNAKDTIDIICWGFDPSLRLSGPKGELRYGELLEQKAKAGVQVRVMIWYSMQGDVLSEKSLPDYRSPQRTFGQDEVNKKIKEAHEALNKAQRKYQEAVNLWRTQDISNVDDPFWQKKDSVWKLEQLKKDMENKQAQFETLYNQAYTHRRGTPNLQYDDFMFNTKWYQRAKQGAVKNLAFTTRDIKDVLAVAEMTKGSEMPSEGVAQFLAGHNNATHHQKMVLIDYTQPNQAVGFVMGHNMQKNYYDDERHAFNSDVRYPGFRPWQDISTRVRGSVLLDLNDNFSNAWDKEIPYDLWSNKKTRIGDKRSAVTIEELSKAAQKKTGYHCPTAQICRTEYSVTDKSILRAYERALGNATDFIYSENQYFRYTPFAKQLKKYAELRKSCNTPNDLYWFVITNNPNSKGETPNTFDMLSVLGQGERLPKLARDERQKLLELRRMKQKLESSTPVGYQKKQIDSLLKKTTEDLAKLEQKYADGNGKQHGVDWAEMEKKNQEEIKDVLDTDDPHQAFELHNSQGLNVHIATLTSCTSASKNNLYTQIYVHSKLLLVDDVFFLLGSANINKRSMEQDTELAIATPTPALASHCRNRLWQMHTKKVKNTTQDNFEHWDKLMGRNWKAMNRGNQLIGTLTHFYDAAAARIPLVGATD